MGPKKAVKKKISPAKELARVMYVSTYVSMCESQGRPVTLEGILESKPEIFNNNISFVLRAVSALGLNHIRPTADSQGQPNLFEATSKGKISGPCKLRTFACEYEYRSPNSRGFASDPHVPFKGPQLSERLDSEEDYAKAPGDVPHLVAPTLVSSQNKTVKAMEPRLHFPSEAKCVLAVPYQDIALKLADSAPFRELGVVVLGCEGLACDDSRIFLNEAMQRKIPLFFLGGADPVALPLAFGFICGSPKQQDAAVTFSLNTDLLGFFVGDDILADDGVFAQEGMDADARNALCQSLEKIDEMDLAFDDVFAQLLVDRPPASQQNLQQRFFTRQVKHLRHGAAQIRKHGKKCTLLSLANAVPDVLARAVIKKIRARLAEPPV